MESSKSSDFRERAVLVLIFAVAMVSVGVPINRSNRFYSAWQGLFGIKIDDVKNCC